MHGRDFVETGAALAASGSLVYGPTFPTICGRAASFPRRELSTDWIKSPWALARTKPGSRFSLPIRRAGTYEISEPG